MSMRTAITSYFDKIVDARFKRDDAGRLVFFPWGFGTGRVVPDAAVEEDLRRATRRLTIGIFAVIIPVVAGFNAIYQLKGLAFVWFFVVCTALGFLTQLYPVWLARNLERSDMRLSYAGSAFSSLDRFGNKFLIFGLVSSAVFAGSAALMLILRPLGGGADPVTMAICLAVFAPLTAVYAIALRRRYRGQPVAG